MSANATTTAPTGRKKLAQGKERSDAALGHDSQNTSSPEGAKELPNGWEWRSFRDATVNHDGRRVPIKEADRAKRSGQYPYYGASGVIDDIDDFLFDGDFLLVAEDGANLLSRSTPIAFKASGKFWVNNHAHVVQGAEGVVQSYLEHFLNSIDLKFFVTGSAQPKLTQANLNKIPIPLAPEREQRRIVAEIEKQFTRLEAGVAALRRMQANLKRYRAAVLKAACEGKLVPTEHELSKSEVRIKKDEAKSPKSRASTSSFLTPTSSLYESGEALLQRILAERRKNWTGRGTYKEPTAPDTANLPPLPEGWTWASLDQIASVALGKMLDKAKHQTGKKLQYLRNINVRWGWVDTDDCLEMFFEDEEIERFSVRAGDVLVCEGGEPGRAAVWNGREAGMMYQKAIHRVRFFGQFQARYLVFLLEFLAKTGRLERWFTGSTIKHFTRESFVTLPIPLPPLAEQTRIVAEVERRLSMVEELESVVSANLQRAVRLRQSILQKAFTGELV